MWYMPNSMLAVYSVKTQAICRSPRFSARASPCLSKLQNPTASVNSDKTFGERVDYISKSNHVNTFYDLRSRFQSAVASRPRRDTLRLRVYTTQTAKCIPSDLRIGSGLLGKAEP
ncbi:hypothetical protein PCANC_13502 [Puccinia coronata f. sp. avenae]|uniref:Uncharacterized protein n=1 Tax=Puccinia coronata f. sp. avenae TaxID=200324 RepID=A0A2N5V4N3_9BASI|nr:hypothetical protein PCANC_13502 [Puccinia coronata f. sp. avenae]